MIKENLKEVVLSQRQRLRIELNLVPRTQFVTITANLNLPHALVVSGIRRSGKSTLLTQAVQQLYNDEFFFLNFEDERLLNFAVSDFEQLYEVFVEIYGERKIFYFDEIQNVPEWERYVRRMQDDGYKFLLTGSNASLLSRELGTKLTGRHISLELFPFSFQEYLLFEKHEYSTDFQYSAKERGELKKQFNQYLANGGMPEYLKYDNENILIRTYEDILYRDIIVRHEIKDVKTLREIGFYLFSNIANRYSYNKIKNMVNLGSVNTVKNYVRYFEDAYIFFSLDKYDYSVKRQVSSDKKIYTIDNGLANAIAFQFSKNIGHYLENLVFLHLRANNKEIYFYRTKNNNEVDFLIRERAKIVCLLQVAFNITDEKTFQREITALLEAMDETGLTEGFILTDNHTETLSFDNKKIFIKPTYQWLLQS